MLIAGASRGMSAQQALSSHTLLGTVTDPGGQPLGGATVELSQAASTNSVRTVVTAGDGRYRLERILPGLYVLTVRLAGFGAAIRDIEIGGGSDEFALDVQLRPLLADNKNAAPPASLGPDRRVVCGLTMITPQNPDRKMAVPNSPPAATIPFNDRLVPTPKRPQDAQSAKGTIRAVQPTICWDPGAAAR
jgi:hypothetical protein